MSSPTTRAATPAEAARVQGRQTKRRRKSGGMLGIGVAALLVYLGWIGREAEVINAGEGLGYFLGIAGAGLMFVLLLYPVRKRVAFMRRFGATKHWFRLHMILGIVGPLLILYHCNFKVGSLNSKVALYCTLLVAASGIVVRYLYSQSHNGLYGRKASLAELTRQMETSSSRLTSSGGMLADVNEQLTALTETVMHPPTTLAESLRRPIAMAFRTRWLYYRLRWQLRKRLIVGAALVPSVAGHSDHFLGVADRFLHQHLTEVRRVAQFGFYERLFSWWHVIHVPFFLMMVFSAIVHVLAVHMY